MSIHRWIRVLSAPAAMHSSAMSLVVGGLGLPFAVAQRQPGAFGQQVGPAVRGLGQFGDRRGILLPPGRQAGACLAAIPAIRP